jgi:hypothetical protein
MTIAICTLMAIVPLFCLHKYGRNSGEIPPNALYAVVGLAILAYWMFNAQLYINMQAAQLIVVMMAWWLACSVISKSTDNALRYFSLYVLGMLPLLIEPDSMVWGAAIVCFGAVINCLCGWMQVLNQAYPSIRIPLVPFVYNWRAIENGWDVKRHTWGLVGYLGNSNFMGSYLVPCFFLSMWLAREIGIVWFYVAVFILLSTLATKCRGAILSIVMGVAYFFAGLIPCFVAAVVLAVVCGLNFESLGNGRERLNYWRVAIKQILKTPLFGLGFDVFKTEVPFLQRDIHEKDQNFLTDKNYLHPYPRMCHNSYLQLALDTGLPGLVLLAAVVSTAIAVPDNQSSKLLLSALVSMLVNGMLFHTWHILSINLLFWFLVGMLSVGNAATAIVFPPYMIAAILIVFSALIYKYNVLYLIYDLLLAYYYRNNDCNMLHRAYNLNSSGTLVNTVFAELFIRSGDILSAFVCAMKALARFDGEVQFWELWNNMGKFFSLFGQPHMAHICFNESLCYKPESNNATKYIEQLAPQETVNG